MSSDQVTLPGHGGGASGTAVAHPDRSSLKMDSATTRLDDGKVTAEGEEQALESHEVIELQTFSERKAWIEEKIKVNQHLNGHYQILIPV